MHIGNGQKFSLAGGKPLVARIGLALRAMAVTARVLRDGRLVAAPRALVSVSTERCRPAALDGREHLPVQSCQPGPVLLDEVLTCRANDIGHLERRPVHFARFLRGSLALAASAPGSASSGFATA